MKFYRFDPDKLADSVKHDIEMDHYLVDLIPKVRPKDCVVLAGCGGSEALSSSPVDGVGGSWSASD